MYQQKRMATIADFHAVSGNGVAHIAIAACYMATVSVSAWCLKAKPWTIATGSWTLAD
jgi:hypothetical protein